MSILSRLKPPAGARKPRNRVGRGIGSGNGKTAGRGQKGQGARSGTGGRLYFEGGQMPAQRRAPKRGFKNNLALTVANVNVGQLDGAFADGAEVTIEAMRHKRLVRGRFDLVKVLGDGELGKRLTVQAHGFSAGARAKIEQAGGTVEVLARRAAAAEAAPGAGEG